jgi:hypothetical protein
VETLCFREGPFVNGPNRGAIAFPLLLGERLSHVPRVRESRQITVWTPAWEVWLDSWNKVVPFPNDISQFGEDSTPRRPEGLRGVDDQARLSQKSEVLLYRPPVSNANQVIASDTKETKTAELGDLPVQQTQH